MRLGLLVRCRTRGLSVLRLRLGMRLLGCRVGHWLSTLRLLLLGSRTRGLGALRLWMLIALLFLLQLLGMLLLL